MRISYTKRQTKNLGNYENVSFEITIEDDVDFSKETQDEAFNRVSNFVKIKLQEQFGTDKLKANVSSNKPVTTNVKPLSVEIVSDDNSIRETDRAYDQTKALILELIQELIKLDPKNGLKIKEILGKYLVTKLKDLPVSELNNFYTDLKHLKINN